MADAITLDDLADLEQPKDIDISPDGKLVVYVFAPTSVKKKEHPTASLWTAKTDKEDSAQQLTSGQWNDSSPSFSPTGKHVAFLSDRANPGKASALYLLSLLGGEALPLTSTDNKESITSFRWSPDGATIAYISPDENSEERKKKDEEKDDVEVADEDIKYGRLRLISIGAHECTTLVSGKFHIEGLHWSPDGSSLVYITQESPKINDRYGKMNCVYTLDMGDRSNNHVGSWLSGIDNPCWTDDGIMWTSVYDKDRLVGSKAVWHIDADRKVKRVGTYGDHNCPFELRVCNGQIMLYVFSGTKSELHKLNSDVIFSEPSSTIISWDVHVDRNDYIITIIKGTSAAPAEVFSIVNGQTRQLSNHNAGIASKQVGKMISLQYTAPDNLPVEARYNIPSKLQSAFDSRQPLPTIVHPHGGPHWRVSDSFHSSYSFDTWLMSHGYLIMHPNYRGGAGYGNTYAATVSGDPAASYQDVVFLTQKGVEDGHIDPARVAILGWSQGGYLSYWAITHPQDFRFAAAIPGAGVSDWDMMTLTSDLENFESELGGGKPWRSQVGASNSGALDHTEDIKVRKGSPLYHMGDHITTPALLIHGKDDVRIPASQAIAFYRGLKDLGKDVEMALYPREGHNPPWERKHYLDMMRRIERFLKKHIG